MKKMLYFMAAALPAMLLINARHSDRKVRRLPEANLGTHSVDRGADDRRYAGIGKNDELWYKLPMYGNIGRFVQMRQNE